MPSRYALTGIVALALATAPVHRAAADAGDFIGGVAAGVIGSALVNSQKNKQRQTTRSRSSSSGYSAQRAAVRETQTVLNYFGFSAGTADGIMGSNTRAAISAYQAFLGMPATGEITQFQRNVLMTAKARADSGAPDVTRLISTDPLGIKAVLMDQYDIMTGKPQKRQAVYAGMPVEVSEAIDEIANSSDPSAEQLLQRSGFIQLADLNADGNTDYIIDTAASGSSFWCNADTCKTLVFASTPNGFSRNDLLLNDPTPAKLSCTGGGCVVDTPRTHMASTQQQAAPQPQPGPQTQMASTGQAQPKGQLPVFQSRTAARSLSSHCSRVSLLTNANGGFTTLAEMSDPSFVLDEQFCLARTYAIEQGERLVSELAGVTPEQVKAQCSQFGAALAPYVSALALKQRPDVIREVGAFVLDSGQSPEQLSVTSKICLSSGYKSDDMTVAIGSALVLVVLGDGAYGELMGHHLVKGIGAPERPDLAAAWYDTALNTLSEGATPVFAPGLSGRTELVRHAVARGRGVAVDPPQEDTVTDAALPTFGTAQ